VPGYSDGYTTTTIKKIIYRLNKKSMLCVNTEVGDNIGWLIKKIKIAEIEIIES